MKRLHLIAGVAWLMAALGCSPAEIEGFSPKTDPTGSHSVPSPDSAQSQLDPFKEGLQQATLGAKLATSARTKMAWMAVASQWEKAIDWMRKVPATTPQYAVARQKIREYERYLVRARQEAKLKLKQETKETKAGQEKLMRKVAKQHGYRPRIVVWKDQKVLALPKAAWSQLTEAQTSLLMDYAESQQATAIAIGTVKNSQTLEIERKVLTLPSLN